MHSEILDFCAKNALDAKVGESLSAHTSIKVGGECALLVTVNDAQMLKSLVSLLKKCKERYFIIGRGSNLLVSDSGFDGAVIKLSGDLAEIEVGDDGVITAGAGLPLKSLCMTAYENSLSGLEFAYGIPGNVGGALFMNAGAYGGQLSDVVISAQYLENDEIKTIDINEMELDYRTSIFMHNRDMIILSVTIKLNIGIKSEIKAKMDELMQKRRDKQPLEYPSAGSMFKRPQGSYASLLIEQCGLKGLSVGGAQVSEKHSGFVINKGDATFADIIALTDEVKRIVLEKTGYSLELEPEIIE